MLRMRFGGWWAALVAVALGAGLLFLVAQFRSDSGASTHGWPRAGQANLAGWAVYQGHADAGADLADAVLAADLDLVGVVEACETQLAEAERRLGQRGPVHVVFQRTVPADHTLPWGAQSDAEWVYGIGLVARGPVTLTDVTAVELPTLDGDPGGFDREEDRWVLCARTASDGTILDGLHVCTTHFTRWEVAEGRRLTQAERLAAHLSPAVADGSSVLVLADLNARRGAPEINPLYDMGLSDVGDGDSRDHLLVSRMRHGALRDTRLGRSDHDLLWAQIATPVATVGRS